MLPKHIKQFSSKASWLSFLSQQANLLWLWQRGVAEGTFRFPIRKHVCCGQQVCKLHRQSVHLPVVIRPLLIHSHGSRCFTEEHSRRSSTQTVSEYFSESFKWEVPENKSLEFGGWLLCRQWEEKLRACRILEWGRPRDHSPPQQ